MLSEDGGGGGGDDDGQMERRFDALCLDLNMDRSSQEEAWQAFERITTNYTLEGDSLHWLACALYVSCRSSMVPAVHGRDMVEGNCVSLTRLLRTAKLSLIEFFKKMKKWADMASLPQRFRDKVERLERNFAVSTVTFKKFEPIFLDIFRSPGDDPVRPPKGRKQKRQTVTAREVFNFCWTMFIQVKGNFPAISDDLVNSYHLLLCCLDWFFANVLLSNRRDLLNPDFSGLPENFQSRDYKPPSEVPCVIKILCDKHQGLHLEAKGIKEHWWKPYIRKLFSKKTLTGKAENLMGVLELSYFEKNNKSISNAYDEYVLNGGDFDERVFLGEDANEEIGTPAKNGSAFIGEASERSQVVRNLWQHLCESKTLAPATPLTNRRYLSEKEGMVTPVSTATQSVSRLQTLLSGRKTCPNEFLLDIFSKCARNPKDSIVLRVTDMGKMFCEKYAQPCDSNPDTVVDFAKRRLQLAESLYYKSLENIILDERQRRSAQDNFLNLLEQDIFHRSLFAICLEIVIFSYNSQRVFPWIIDIFEIPAYYFYKVIEVLIRAEEGLSRDIVKHLNHIEETALESLVWKSDSPLWDAVHQCGSIPSVEDVSFPSQLERDNPSGSSNVLANLTSPPLVHPAVRRVATTDSLPLSRQETVQSLGTLSASDRFSSPVNAKRRLFPNTPSTEASPLMTSSSSSIGSTTGSSVPIPVALITAQDGRQILIPVQVRQSPLKRKTDEQGDSSSNAKAPSVQPTNRPKRIGSLALFFRKLYHLASVRLRDLCDRLDIDSELCSKIWTCFEHGIINHIDLFQDRHLDQLIMCAVYVICKVSEKDRSFQDIMKRYRLQPQAESHVYRSVLLSSRHRYESGNSSNDNSNANCSISPAITKNERKGRKERDSNLNSIRSSSTLPAPQPSSQPPTPTRIAGAANSFQFDDRGEDRGDLIKFYNAIYVGRIKNYALKFSSQNLKDGAEKLTLSPLPVVQSHCSSPRKISTNHSLYISPHKGRSRFVTPKTGMLYCFNKSPARDLHAINCMIQTKDNGLNSVAKRLPLADDGMTECPPKRLLTSSSPIGLTKRLEELMHDRQANGSN